MSDSKTKVSTLKVQYIIILTQRGHCQGHQKVRVRVSYVTERVWSNRTICVSMNIICQGTYILGLYWQQWKWWDLKVFHMSWMHNCKIWQIFLYLTLYQLYILDFYGNALSLIECFYLNWGNDDDALKFTTKNGLFCLKQINFKHVKHWSI